MEVELTSGEKHLSALQIGRGGRLSARRRRVSSEDEVKSRSSAQLAVVVPTVVYAVSALSGSDGS